jgi:hypothetical protein
LPVNRKFDALLKISEAQLEVVEFMKNFACGLRELYDVSDNYVRQNRRQGNNRQ